jgi:glucokinase
MRIVAGDIGGTTTRLLFAEKNAAGRILLAEKRYPSAQYSNFLEILELFLSEHDIDVPVDAACFAIAGPVESAAVSVTNLPWVIRQQPLCELLQTPDVALINDFVAVAYGIPGLDETDFLLLQQGLATEQKAINPDAAVVGAGTGLGVAHLVWQKNHYKPYSSEAGHVGFAPENALQTELLSWMQRKHDHVSLEWLLSGKGLVTIYHFLHKVTGIQESPDISEAMQDTDPAQVISEFANRQNDELCQTTLEMFIDIYGAAAGNAALHYYPIGVLYIAGGIAAKIKDSMVDGRFTAAFNNKGAMSSVMQKITIKLISQDKVGLYGALSCAEKLQTAS